MPRQLLTRRYWERQKLKRRAVWQVPTHPPEFLDNFPDVIGTMPEKLVFNWLAARHINFYFTPYFGDIPFTQDVHERYRPDFILPDYNIILEVIGTYWHSRLGSYEHDYTRAGLLEASGWHLITIFDLDVVQDVESSIVEAVPILLNPPITGTARIVSERPANPTAPIIARIKARPKLIVTKWKQRRGIRKPLVAWQAQKKIKAETKTYPIFTHLDFDPVYLVEIKQFGQEWRDYINQLGDYIAAYAAYAIQWNAYMNGLTVFFQTYPEAALYYPTEYATWYEWYLSGAPQLVVPPGLSEEFEKWKDWWDRFRSI